MDLVQFLELVRFIESNPVVPTMMVEIPKNYRSRWEQPKTLDGEAVPPPADQPQSVMELAGMFKGMEKKKKRR